MLASPGSLIKKTLVALVAHSLGVGYTLPSTIRWSSSMMSRMPMIRIRPTVFPIYDPTLNLQQNTEANYNFITPNLCNDMHDTCAPLFDSVKQGDTWLAQNLPTILNSQAYMNGGIVFITWDEGEGGDGPIGMT